MTQNSPSPQESCRSRVSVSEELMMIRTRVPKYCLKYVARLTMMALAVLLTISPTSQLSAAPELRLPWRQAGLTEEQAAAHLLNRLAFGARPGDVNRLIERGFEPWIEEQLAADQPDVDLRGKLPMNAIGLSAREVGDLYPRPGELLRMARQEGILPEDLDPNALDTLTEAERESFRTQLMSFAEEKGYRPQRELLIELMGQKLLRAVESPNQLEEVLTDFWFNHFNVSLTDPQSRLYILPYEQEAIRPHVLGSFRDMLGATAKHPAMLLYLDNAQSTAGDTSTTSLDLAMQKMGERRSEMTRRRNRSDGRTLEQLQRRRRQNPNRPNGLNENYARELLELHTLGVDGGYTQEDVIEVARALTGWTVYPNRQTRERLGRRFQQVLASGMGFVAEDGFLFRADAHDAGRKVILGTTFPPGGGMEEGEKVLDLVAGHPSTARHLAHKLAVRFVADEPPAALVDRLARSFRTTHGDLQAVIRTLVQSAEFWDPGFVGQKIRSPFELAVSAFRALDVNIRLSRELIDWVERMGQPLYAYQAPTGYPDRADFWVNTGSLLNRMNFGLALAANRVDGASVDLPALNEHREPESRLHALQVYAPKLLPGRDVSATIALLEPMVSDPSLSSRVDDAAPRTEPAAFVQEMERESFGLFGPTASDRRRRNPPDRTYDPPTPLQQVVGLILGSPEFQRR